MSPFETPQSVSHLRRIVQWCSAVRAIRQTCRFQFAKTENPEKLSMMTVINFKCDPCMIFFPIKLWGIFYRNGFYHIFIWIQTRVSTPNVPVFIFFNQYFSVKFLSQMYLLEFFVIKHFGGVESDKSLPRLELYKIW